MTIARPSIAGRSIVVALTVLSQLNVFAGAQNHPKDLVGIGTSYVIVGDKASPMPANLDLAEFDVLGSRGGRAGLPAVRLQCRKSQTQLFRHGAPAWIDIRSDIVDYPGWNFWLFGVWDVLLQVFCEQATDPQAKPQSLGIYHLHLKDSSIRCWTDSGDLPTGLVLDLTKDLPVSNSLRLDRYVTYGLGYHVNYSGKARFLLTINKKRNVNVQLIESNLPRPATDSLKQTLEALSSHPALSFPADDKKTEQVQLVADFVIDRKPGPLTISKRKR